MSHPPPGLPGIDDLSRRLREQAARLRDPGQLLADIKNWIGEKLPEPRYAPPKESVFERLRREREEARVAEEDARRYGSGAIGTVMREVPAMGRAMYEHGKASWQALKDAPQPPEDAPRPEGWEGHWPPRSVQEWYRLSALDSDYAAALRHQQQYRRRTEDLAGLMRLGGVPPDITKAAYGIGRQFLQAQARTASLVPGVQRLPGVRQLLEQQRLESRVPITSSASSPTMRAFENVGGAFSPYVGPGLVKGVMNRAGAAAARVAPKALAPYAQTAGGFGAIGGMEGAYRAGEEGRSRLRGAIEGAVPEAFGPFATAGYLSAATGQALRRLARLPGGVRYAHIEGRPPIDLTTPTQRRAAAALRMGAPTAVGHTGLAGTVWLTHPKEDRQAILEESGDLIGRIISGNEPAAARAAVPPAIGAAFMAAIARLLRGGKAPVRLRDTRGQSALARLSLTGPKERPAHMLLGEIEKLQKSGQGVPGELLDMWRGLLRAAGNERVSLDDLRAAALTREGMNPVWRIGMGERGAAGGTAEQQVPQLRQTLDRLTDNLQRLPNLIRGMAVGGEVEAGSPLWERYASERELAQYGAQHEVFRDVADRLERLPHILEADFTPLIETLAAEQAQAPRYARRLARWYRDELGLARSAVEQLRDQVAKLTELRLPGGGAVPPEQLRQLTEDINRIDGVVGSRMAEVERVMARVPASVGVSYESTAIADPNAPRFGYEERLFRFGGYEKYAGGYGEDWPRAVERALEVPLQAIEQRSDYAESPAAFRAAVRLLTLREGAETVAGAEVPAEQYGPQEQGMVELRRLGVPEEPLRELGILLSGGKLETGPLVRARRGSPPPELSNVEVVGDQVVGVVRDPATGQTLYDVAVPKGQSLVTEALAQLVGNPEIAGFVSRGASVRRVPEAGHFGDFGPVGWARGDIRPTEQGNVAVDWELQADGAQRMQATAEDWAPWGPVQAPFVTEHGVSGPPGTIRSEAARLRRLAALESIEARSPEESAELQTLRRQAPVPRPFIGPGDSGMARAMAIRQGLLTAAAEPRADWYTVVDSRPMVQYELQEPVHTRPWEYEAVNFRLVGHARGPVRPLQDHVEAVATEWLPEGITPTTPVPEQVVLEYSYQTPYGRWIKRGRTSFPIAALLARGVDPITAFTRSSLTEQTGAWRGTMAMQYGKPLMDLVPQVWDAIRSEAALEAAAPEGTIAERPLHTAESGLLPEPVEVAKVGSNNTYRLDAPKQIQEALRLAGVPKSARTIETLEVPAHNLRMGEKPDPRASTPATVSEQWIAATEAPERGFAPDAPEAGPRVLQRDKNPFNANWLDSFSDRVELAYRWALPPDGLGDTRSPPAPANRVGHDQLVFDRLRSLRYEELRGALPPFAVKARAWIATRRNTPSTETHTLVPGGGRPGSRHNGWGLHPTLRWRQTSGQMQFHGLIWRKGIAQYAAGIRYLYEAHGWDILLPGEHGTLRWRGNWPPMFPRQAEGASVNAADRESAVDARRGRFEAAVRAGAEAGGTALTRRVLREALKRADWQNTRSRKPAATVRAALRAVLAELEPAQVERFFAEERVGVGDMVEWDATRMPTVHELSIAAGEAAAGAPGQIDPFVEYMARYPASNSPAVFTVRGIRLTPEIREALLRTPPGFAEGEAQGVPAYSGPVAGGGRGALVGGLLGGAIAGGAGVLAGDDKEQALTKGLLGAAAGAGIGARLRARRVAQWRARPEANIVATDVMEAVETGTPPELVPDVARASAEGLRAHMPIYERESLRRRVARTEDPRAMGRLQGPGGEQVVSLPETFSEAFAKARAKRDQEVQQGRFAEQYPGPGIMGPSGVAELRTQPNVLDPRVQAGAPDVGEVITDPYRYSAEGRPPTEPIRQPAHSRAEFLRALGVDKIEDWVRAAEEGGHTGKLGLLIPAGLLAAAQAMPKGDDKRQVLYALAMAAIPGGKGGKPVERWRVMSSKTALPDETAVMRVARVLRSRPAELPRLLQPQPYSPEHEFVSRVLLRLGIEPAWENRHWAEFIKGATGGRHREDVPQAADDLSEPGRRNIGHAAKAEIDGRLLAEAWDTRRPEVIQASVEEAVYLGKVMDMEGHPGVRGLTPQEAMGVRALAHSMSRAAVQRQIARIAALREPVGSPSWTDAVQALLHDIPTERGAADLSVVAGISGAGLGAVAGALAPGDDDDRWKRMLAGAIIGGALLGGGAAAFGRGARGLGEKGTSVMLPSKAPERAERRPPMEGFAEYTPPPGQSAPEPVGGRESLPRVARAEDYINFAKFDLDPTGVERLRTEVERLVTQVGIHPKQRVPWSETRRLASELGIDAEGLQASTIDRRLSGPEMLAIRNIISGNIYAMTRWASAMRQPRVTPIEREELMRRVNAAELQNRSLLERFIRARTETGRDLNNLKIVANRTMDPVYWLARARQLTRGVEQVKLPDGRRVTQQEIQTTVARLAAERDRGALVRYMMGLRQSSMVEKLQTLWKAGLLTSPKTHALNIVSNTTMAVLEGAKENVALFADRLLGLAAAGVGHLPGGTPLETRPRTISPTSWTVIQESAKGALAGLREAREVMQGAQIPEALERYDLPRETNYDSAVLNVYTRGVFRSLEAADRVFRGFALRGSLVHQAQVLARGEGLRGTEYRARVEELVRAPTDEMALQAIADAEIATFRERTTLAKWASPMARHPVGGFILPFSRTPSAVATSVARYTPFGFWGAGMDAMEVLKQAYKGRAAPDLQQRAARRFGRAATGTFFIWLGYQLAKDDKMTGGYPTTRQTERELWEATGRQANSLLVDGQWVNVGRISPIGNLLAVGANLYEIEQRRQTPASNVEQMAEAAASIGKTIADQPFVQGLRQTTEAAQDPLEAGAKVGRSFVGSFIPAGVAAAARGTDPYQRDTRSLASYLQSRVPGVSRTVPPARTTFGEPRQRAAGVAARLFNEMVNPMAGRPDVRRTDPVARELWDIGWAPARERRDPRETAARFSERQMVVGRALREIVEQTMASPRYAAARSVEQAAGVVADSLRARGLALPRETVVDALLAEDDRFRSREEQLRRATGTRRGQVRRALEELRGARP